MTVTSYSSAWRLWLASGNPRNWACDALQFHFDDSDEPELYLANRLYETPTQQLKDEANNWRTYQQVAFTVGLPNKQMNLEYGLSVQMDNVPGAMLDFLGSLQGSELDRIVTVYYRIYLLPDKDDEPAIKPPMRLQLAAVSLTRTSLQLTCQPTTLSKKRAGESYTLEEFPGLATY